MVTARFEKEENQYCAFEISGHAGYADKGSDIVCAAVTSSVQLAVNTMMDIVGQKADIKVEENHIVFRLDSQQDRCSDYLMRGLYQHLAGLSEEYPENVEVLEKQAV